MKYYVIYTSSTGNTKKLAETVFNTIAENKIINTISETNIEDINDTDIIFLGYWVDKNTCNSEAIEFIKKLNNKKIAVFGTMGMGNIPEYTEKVKRNVKELFLKNNLFLGSFICMGKMKPSVREKYVKILENNPNDLIINKLIDNFDNAITHPDENDLENLKKFVFEIIKNF